MSQKIKELIQKELKTRFEDVNDLIVVSLRGISGNDNNALRGELLEKQIRVRVVNNSLAGRVFEEAGMGDLRDILSGPCAIAYGGDSVVDVAKDLVEWEKKLENFSIKGGFLDGRVLDADQARDLSKLPTRTELQGMLVVLANSPGSRVASAIGAPAGVIAGCVKALIEKLEAA
ncbi:MAG: 50S ribosomal protein L10 [Sedimentisphaerales bacterium]|nr:50S ribosomal protein L10 [Sedimentisphaerales bacterium]